VVVKEAAVGTVMERRADEVDRLTGRIALLLEETAHQGLLALRLLMQARELAMEADEDDAVRRILSNLATRLGDLEREGRDRLRQARRLLRIGRPER
jgi:hypothetical protein